jgi:hypothetical protein
MARVREPIAGSTGFDDLSGERQTMHDAHAQPWIGEGPGPPENGSLLAMATQRPPAQ